MIDFSEFQGKKVGVAVSGGRDSMALLHLLLSHRDGFSLFAIHCEHGIRGTASISDMEFVKDYCDRSGVPLFLFSEDCPFRAKNSRVSLETAAREFRYEAFGSLLSERKLDLILTAHHQADNVETVLFRLFRGTALSGVSGILDREGFARPLLHVSRSEIDRYVATNRIPYREDETNASLDASRNFIRNELIPLIEERFPAFSESIDRFSFLAREDEKLLSSLAEPLVDGDSVLLSDKFPLFSRAALIVLKRLGLDADYSTKHLSDLFALTQKENGKSVTLPRGIKAYREYDRITFQKEASPIPETPFSMIPLIDSDLGLGAFDPDKVPPSAVLRTRKDGDKFQPYKGHTKNLGDWMTDKKIPLKDRDLIPVLADGSEILVVCGYEISDKVKVSTDSKRICRMITEIQTR